MTKTLLLFDIDGTLVVGNKTHTYAMKKALKDVFDVDKEIIIKDISGKTDRQIMTDILLENNIKKQDIDDNVDKVIHNMVKTFNDKGLPDMTILPGVKELLVELSKRDDLILGLLTGNPEQLAYIKLAHFSIKKYFTFGFFGHEHNSRAELVKDSLKKAKERFDFDEAIIIGDTIRDVEAARYNNLKVIAVATGYTDYDNLNKANPDYLFKDLSDTKKVIEAIENGR